MKYRIYNKTIAKVSFLLGLALVMLTVHSCEDEEQTPFYSKNQLLITSYVEQNEEFSEFAELLRLSKVNAPLNARGTYTCFVPNNEAFKAFKEKKGISNLSELNSEDPDFLKKLVWNHLITARAYTAFDFPQGILPDTTAFGNPLLTEMGEGGLKDILVNKKAKIKSRDIEVANGVIHEIDQVLDLAEWTVLFELQQHEKYSIFVEALKKTGIADTLAEVKSLNNKTGKYLRNRFTILAETDEVLRKAGIDSYDALKEKYSPDADDVTDSSNGLYQFMAYHVVKGQFFMNDLENRNYENLSEELISFDVVKGYRINYVKYDETENWNEIDVKESNHITRNGVVHTTKDHLPVFSPEPARYVWKAVDDPEIRKMEGFGEIYGLKIYNNELPTMRWWNTKGQITLWNYSTIGCGGEAYWIEYLIPKIVKGKYRVVARLGHGPHRGTAQSYMDGQKIGKVIDCTNKNSGLWGNFFVYLGNVNFEKTKSHVLKSVSVSPGNWQLESINLIPLDEEYDHQIGDRWN
ncbi:MAG: fasciclin domain-containing protein [Cytophagales bacterium]|nr:fasciclin domain-containing protein [Cytophagales bacterium]